MVPRQVINPHIGGGSSIHAVTVAPPCFNCHLYLRHPNDFRPRSPIRLDGRAPHYIRQGALCAGKAMESEPFGQYLNRLIEPLRSCGGLHLAVYLLHTSDTCESTVRVIRVDSVID